MYTPPRKKGPRRNLPQFTGKVLLRTGDTVRVITGKDKGKEGKVTQVLRAAGKVLVEGVNIFIKHKKASPQANQTVASQQQQSGRIEMSAPLHISKVQLVDPADNKTATRIGIKTNAKGERVRFAKKSGGVIENG